MNQEEEYDFQQAAKLVENRRIFIGLPRPVSGLAARIIGRYGVAAEQATKELDEVWNAIVGENYRSQTIVGTIKRQKLEIFCANSLVNQQLTFEKQRLLQELNQRIPRLKIKDILFRIGATPTS